MSNIVKTRGNLTEFNVEKTVHCIFHLNNNQANRKLDVTPNNGEMLEYNAKLEYTGNNLFLSLTGVNIERIKTYLKSRVYIIQKHRRIDLNWLEKTLIVITLSIVMSAICMIIAHTNKVDTQTNCALPIISEAVDPTEVEGSTNYRENFGFD